MIITDDLDFAATALGEPWIGILTGKRGDSMVEVYGEDIGFVPHLDLAETPTLFVVDEVHDPPLVAGFINADRIRCRNHSCSTTINFIGVHRRYRRKGIGCVLLSSFVDYLASLARRRSPRAKFILLSVESIWPEFKDDRVVQFYAAQGFRVVSVVLGQVLMAKEITLVTPPKKKKRRKLGILVSNREFSKKSRNCEKLYETYSHFQTTKELLEIAQQQPDVYLAYVNWLQVHRPDFEEKDNGYEKRKRRRLS